MSYRNEEYVKWVKGFAPNALFCEDCGIGIMQDLGRQTVCSLCARERKQPPLTKFFEKSLKEDGNFD